MKNIELREAPERDVLLAQRADSCIQNWQFDCAASSVRSRPLTDAERHMLKHQIKRQSLHSEYEVTRLLCLCLHACKISLACEKDCGREKDDLGEDYFAVKMMKDAIEQARTAGFQ